MKFVLIFCLNLTKHGVCLSLAPERGLQVAKGLIKDSPEQKGPGFEPDKPSVPAGQALQPGEPGWLGLLAAEPLKRR